jgi:hypothetical protein
VIVKILNKYKPDKYCIEIISPARLILYTILEYTKTDEMTFNRILDYLIPGTKSVLPWPLENPV